MVGQEKRQAEEKKGPGHLFQTVELHPQLGVAQPAADKQDQRLAAGKHHPHETEQRSGDIAPCPGPQRRVEKEGGGDQENTAAYRRQKELVELERNRKRRTRWHGEGLYLFASPGQFFFTAGVKPK